MKIQLLIGLFCVALGSQPLLGGDLTPEQIESLRLKLTQVKSNLEGHISNRNQSARSVFATASNDPRAAVKLYLDCYKKVNYELEGRSESDFRVWKEGQEDTLKSKQFAQSAMITVRYLALSCHAAEVEELDEVFGALNQYVESLSHLDELPNRILTSNVSNSVFCKAFQLEKLLGKNDMWEPVPYNIPGIYDKAILPYIREKNPDSLMNAWDKRIEQEKRLVLFFEAKKKEALRGLSREEKVRARDRLENGGGRAGRNGIRDSRERDNEVSNIMKTHDLDDFNRVTLPRLQWNRLLDMYAFIDQLGAAKAMLSFVEANLKNPNGEDFFKEFNDLLEGPRKSG